MKKFRLWEFLRKKCCWITLVGKMEEWEDRRMSEKNGHIRFQKALLTRNLSVIVSFNLELYDVLFLFLRLCCRFFHMVANLVKDEKQWRENLLEITGILFLQYRGSRSSSNLMLGLFLYWNGPPLRIYWKTNSFVIFTIFLWENRENFTFIVEITGKIVKYTILSGRKYYKILIKYLQ